MSNVSVNCKNNGSGIKKKVKIYKFIAIPKVKRATPNFCDNITLLRLLIAAVGGGVRRDRG